MLDRVLSEQETAQFLQLSARTLQRLRQAGDGPQYYRLGERRIGYRMSDIEAWLDGCRRQSQAHELSL